MEVLKEFLLSDTYSSHVYNMVQELERMEFWV